MSITKRVLDGFLDDMVDQLKVQVEEFADTMLLDMERHAMRLFRRAVKLILLTTVGGFLLAASSIFILVGVAELLAPAVGMALGWTVAGIIGAAFGGALIFAAKSGMPSSRVPREE